MPSNQQPYRKAKLILIAVIAVLAARTGVSHAEGTNESRDADQMFRNLDSNRDGRLQIDEAGPGARGLMEKVFQMAGKPTSESVSRAEFQQVFDKHRAGSGAGGGGTGGRGSTRPRAGGRPPVEEDTPASDDGGLPSVLAQLDADGDGRLTRTELQRLIQMFEQLDFNQDGALTAAELRGVDLPPRSENRSKTAGRSPRSNNTSQTTSKQTASKDSEESSTTKSDASTSTGRKNSGRDSNRSIPGGVWRGWVVNGRGETPNSGQMEIELTVEGNRITGRELGTRRAPEGIGGGTFVSTGDGRTGNLDAEGTSGPQDGRSFLGIYEYDGEVLKWCVSNRGRQRPQTMATDRGNYLMILRQEK